VKIANKWNLGFHLPTQLFHKIKRGGSRMVVTAGSKMAGRGCGSGSGSAQWRQSTAVEVGVVVA